MTTVCAKRRFRPGSASGQVSFIAAEIWAMSDYADSACVLTDRLCAKPSPGRRDWGWRGGRRQQPAPHARDASADGRPAQARLASGHFKLARRHLLRGGRLQTALAGC